MNDLPPFKPPSFPNFLFAKDALVQVPIEKLEDWQVLKLWRSWEADFLAHVQKRRKHPIGSTPKRWGR